MTHHQNQNLSLRILVKPRKGQKEVYGEVGASWYAEVAK
jgi:hypothetical protein